MTDLAKVAIVAHDAGGAEILSSYVRREGAEFVDRCVFVLAGPARSIFHRKLGLTDTLPLAEALPQASTLLCGTGWQSDWEVNAIRTARHQGTRSIAFLDHWVNYRERFLRNGVMHLPDEIWVGDAIALGLAQSVLPDVPAKLIDNPYFLDIQDELAAHPGRSNREAGAGGSILYICEPVREHALKQHGNQRHWGYTEEDALRYFLEHRDMLGSPISQIVLRPHPSEAPDKYRSIATQAGPEIQLSDGGDLMAEIAGSDCVVGCNSMAMVIALLADKRVICSIPPGGRPCLLPQPGIVQLQALVASAQAAG